MSVHIPVIEAVEWREPAPGGGSQGQVFRLSDNRFAIVKFPENPQGERVLPNEFMSCNLAELLSLPINRTVLVSIDERLLRLPRQSAQIPATFSAGIRCGMIRFEGAQPASPIDIKATCNNCDDLHSVIVFEQMVSRQDGQQLLTYTNSSGGTKHFAAYDYGFAFGGQPNWTGATLVNIAATVLPVNDPYTNSPYADGTKLTGIIERMRNLTEAELKSCLLKLHPPRWGVTVADIDALAPVIHQRAQSLVSQYDQRYQQQLGVI